MSGVGFYEEAYIEACRLLRKADRVLDDPYPDAVRQLQIDIRCFLNVHPPGEVSFVAARVSSGTGDEQ